MNEETPKKRRDIEERRFRLRLVMIVLPAFFGTLMWTNVDRLSDLVGISYTYLLWVAAYLFLASGTYFLLTYLRGGINVPYINRFTSSMKPSLGSENSSSSIVTVEIEKLKKKISEVSYAQVQLRKGQQDAIIQELKDTISSDLAAEMEKLYSIAALTTAQIKQAKENYRNSIERLSKEIETLTRRANLNLVIGVLTTSIAVGLLTYMVLGISTQLETLTGLLSYYVPRITLVIFIEVFSFFFLKMYRSNLSEIKYYQQEITKISTEQIAYESVILSNDNGALLSFVNIALRKDVREESNSLIPGASAQIEHLSKIVQETSKIISNLSKKSQS